MISFEAYKYCSNSSILLFIPNLWNSVSFKDTHWFFIEKKIEKFINIIVRSVNFCIKPNKLNTSCMYTFGIVFKDNEDYVNSIVKDIQLGEFSFRKLSNKSGSSYYLNLRTIIYDSDLLWKDNLEFIGKFEMYNGLFNTIFSKLYKNLLFTETYLIDDPNIILYNLFKLFLIKEWSVNYSVLDNNLLSTLYKNTINDHQHIFLKPFSISL